MMDGSLERSSRVSSQLVEQIPKISRPTFEIQTELNLRVNSGMFEFMGDKINKFLCTAFIIQDGVDCPI